MTKNGVGIMKKTSNKGKKFERNFRDSAIDQGVLIVRLNDTNLSFIPGKEENSRFTADNPCDFILYEKPNIYFLELKSTEYSSISIQRLPTGPKDKMIKAHQINSLTQFSLCDGAICGFIFNFREKDSYEETTYFLNIKDFNTFLCESDKKSINKLDIVQYGGIVLKQVLKRTQYTYNVKDFINRTQEL